MMQDVFPVLDGSLSWIPYLVVAVAGALVAALVVQRVVSGVPRRSKGAQ